MCGAALRFEEYADIMVDCREPLRGYDTRRILEWGSTPSNGGSGSDHGSPLALGETHALFERQS